MTIELKEKLYTSTQVADILGVSLRTLYRYMDDGKILSMRTASGRHRFTREHILTFLNGGVGETLVKEITRPDGQDLNSTVTNANDSIGNSREGYRDYGLNRVNDDFFSGGSRYSQDSNRLNDATDVSRDKYNQPQFSQRSSLDSYLDTNDIPQNFQSSYPKSQFSLNESREKNERSSVTRTSEINDDQMNNRLKSGTSVSSNYVNDDISPKYKPELADFPRRQTDDFGWTNSAGRGNTNLQKDERSRVRIDETDSSTAISSFDKLNYEKTKVDVTDEVSGANIGMNYVDQDKRDHETSYNLKKNDTLDSSRRATQVEPSNYYNSQDQRDNSYSAGLKDDFYTDSKSNYDNKVPSREEIPVRNSDDNRRINSSDVASSASFERKVATTDDINRTPTVQRQEENKSENGIKYYKAEATDLIELAKKINNMASSKKLDYAFSLYAGLSLHYALEKPFEILHIYANPEDLQVWKNVLDLKTVPSSEANLSIIVNSDIAFVKNKSIGGYRVVEDDILLRDLALIKEFDLVSEFRSRISSR